MASAPYMAGALTHYVDLNSASPTPPYTNWATAAHTLQDAVDVATDGAVVLVNTGTYSVGGALTPGFALANRVVVTNAISLVGIGGPEQTIILGENDTGIRGLGSNAVRAVYLSQGAIMQGFTISNGATFGITSDTGDSVFERSGGGAFLYNATLSNCIIRANAAQNYGGGVFARSNAVMHDLHIENNWTYAYGGGVAWENSGMLYNSYIVNNIVSNWDGGGIHARASGTISNCVIHGNSAQRGSGGGVLVFRAFLTLSDSLIISNYASNRGGGTFINSWEQWHVIVDRCRFAFNRIDGTQFGAGAYFTYADVRNSLFDNNSGTTFGGAVASFRSPMRNCTIVNNHTTASAAGGIYMLRDSTNFNCIVYHNTAATTNHNIYFNPAQTGQASVYTCTYPLATGEGNITNAPHFIDMSAHNYRLMLGSPTINAGNNAYVISDIDLDGLPRILQATVDMGAYETIPEPSILSALFLFLLLYRKII